MRFFKRHKSKAAPAEWLVKCRGWIDQRQRKIADALSRKTQYWSKDSWIVALVVFILLFGGCCLLLLRKAFIHL